MRLDGGIEGPGADFGVGLHDLKLLAVELAGLQQDAVGDAYLADVVQRARHVHELHVIAVDVIAELGIVRQMLGDRAAVFPNPLQVRAGVRIAGLGQFR